MPSYLYKIMLVTLWAASQGKESIELGPSDQIFIHLSEHHTIEKIIKKFFSQVQSVIVLTLDPDKLEGRLVKEKNPGGTNEYYHLYDGRIPLNAVINAKEVSTHR